MSEQKKVNVDSKPVDKMLQDGQFLIPLYQRDYAWGREEIYQLLRDLSQTGERTYYLGTLVVMQRGDMLEVVDGQQRLTTLTLLYRYLKLLEKNPLYFENRLTAIHALEQVFDSKDSKEIEDVRFRDAIGNIDTYIKSFPDSEEAIKSCLQGKLMLFQVTLPAHTDVAAYFEVMNNRGRQLEAHEILKAKLMAEIKAGDYETRKKIQESFAKRWENCKGEDSESPGETLTNRLVKKKDGEYVSESPAEDEGRTLLTFPRLLLIALRCYFNDEKREISLNDRNLLKTFEDNKVEPMAFIETLEKVREDFDSHVIRSVVAKDSDGGRWSLKFASYDKEKEEINLEKTYQNEAVERRIIQLQSLLQVSGISWIPDFLFERWQKRGILSGYLKWWIPDFLFERWQKKDAPLDFDIAILEEFIRRKLKPTEDEKLSFEALSYASRPLLALNVLDYLFWQKAEEGDLEDGDKRDKDFIFRYRNSIEHFYPQDDTSCGSEGWNIGDEKLRLLNCIGNLYLTTGKVNSKLSNYPPSSKIDLWNDKSSPMTPKQRRMYDIVRTEKAGKQTCWTVKDCIAHANVCWRLFAEFLGEDSLTELPSLFTTTEDVLNTSGAGENGSAGE